MTTSSTNRVQRIMNSPAVKRLRTLEHARIQRLQTAGRTLAQTAKETDDKIKKTILETAAADLRDVAEVLGSLLEPADLEQQ